MVLSDGPLVTIGIPPTIVQMIFSAMPWFLVTDFRVTNLQIL